MILSHTRSLFFRQEIRNEEMGEKVLHHRLTLLQSAISVAAETSCLPHRAASIRIEAEESARERAKSDGISRKESVACPRRLEQRMVRRGEGGGGEAQKSPERKKLTASRSDVMSVSD